jgi:hypothetical protein
LGSVHPNVYSKDSPQNRFLGLFNDNKICCCSKYLNIFFKLDNTYMHGAELRFLGQLWAWLGLSITLPAILLLLPPALPLGIQSHVNICKIFLADIKIKFWVGLCTWWSYRCCWHILTSPLRTYVILWRIHIIVGKFLNFFAIIPEIKFMLEVVQLRHWPFGALIVTSVF